MKNQFREANSIRTALSIIHNYQEEDFSNYCSDFYIKRTDKGLYWLNINLSKTTKTNMTLHKDESGKWKHFIELPFLHDQKGTYQRNLVTFKGRQLNAIGERYEITGVVYHNPKTEDIMQMLMENFEGIQNYKHIRKLS